MEKYILAIDQSTTATKAILFDMQAHLAARHDIPHRQITTSGGWVEHDAMEIYRNVIFAMRSVLEKAKVPPEAVQVIALTNQRETTVVWDADTGLPVYNAIVWQCSRGADIAESIRQSGNDLQVEVKTGMKLSPYFSAIKARWIADNVRPSGKTMFGTMDSWVAWKLTGVHATDYSNASRTQLFNIYTLEWDNELLKLFGLEHMRMPAVKCSDEIFGYTTAEGLFAKPVPVSGVIGDSQGALFGQRCFSPGAAKATLGTGTSVMMNAGEKPLQPYKGLVTSIGWGIGGRVTYVLEGNINSSGDTVKWLAEKLNILEKAEDSAGYAEKLPDNGGVYIVPAFNGLGAPYWVSGARATIFGLSKNTDKTHVVRAGLESIAYQIKDILNLMLERQWYGKNALLLDGGAVRNAWLMQFIADMLQKSAVKSKIEELSALGAALLAGLAVGIWRSAEDLPAHAIDMQYEPSMPEAEMLKLYEGWKRAVAATLYHAVNE